MRNGIADKIAQRFRTAGMARLRADLVDRLEKIIIDGDALHLPILFRAVGFEAE